MQSTSDLDHFREELNSYIFTDLSRELGRGMSKQMSGSTMVEAGLGVRLNDFKTVNIEKNCNRTFTINVKVGRRNLSDKLITPGSAVMLIPFEQKLFQEFRVSAGYGKYAGLVKSFRRDMLSAVVSITKSEIDMLLKIPGSMVLSSKPKVKSDFERFFSGLDNMYNKSEVFQAMIGFLGENKASPYNNQRYMPTPAALKMPLQNVLPDFNGFKPETKEPMNQVLTCRHFNILWTLPGTSRDMFIIKIIQALTGMAFRVLYCSKTHSKVDRMLLQLSQNPGTLASAHVGKIGSAEKTLDSVKKFSTKIEGNSLSQVKNALKNKKVVFATHDILMKDHFAAYYQSEPADFVIIEESGVCNFYSSIASVCHGKRVLVIGDHYQSLVFTSSRNQVVASESLLERLVTKSMECPHSKRHLCYLRLQNKHSPPLIKACNGYFYQNRIISDRKCSNFFLCNSVTGLTTSPIALDKNLVWVDHRSLEKKHKKSGFSNEIEAQIALKIVSGLTSGNKIKNTSITLMTFYKKQTEILKHYIPQVNVELVDSCPFTISDIVIVSAVRCNNESKLGFLANQHRLNIASTRASKMLIIIGSAETLISPGGFAATLFEQSKREGQYFKYDLSTKQMTQIEQRQQPIAPVVHETVIEFQRSVINKTVTFVDDDVDSMSSSEEATVPHPSVLTQRANPLAQNPIAAMPQNQRQPPTAAMPHYHGPPLIPAMPQYERPPLIPVMPQNQRPPPIPANWADPPEGRRRPVFEPAPPQHQRPSFNPNNILNREVTSIPTRIEQPPSRPGPPVKPTLKSAMQETLDEIKREKGREANFFEVIGAIGVAEAKVYEFEKKELENAGRSTEYPATVGLFRGTYNLLTKYWPWSVEEEIIEVPSKPKVRDSQKVKDSADAIRAANLRGQTLFEAEHRRNERMLMREQVNYPSFDSKEEQREAEHPRNERILMREQVDYPTFDGGEEQSEANAQNYYTVIIDDGSEDENCEMDRGLVQSEDIPKNQREDAGRRLPEREEDFSLLEALSKDDDAWNKKQSADKTQNSHSETSSSDISSIPSNNLVHKKTPSKGFNQSSFVHSSQYMNSHIELDLDRFGEQDADDTILNILTETNKSKSRQTTKHEGMRHGLQPVEEQDSQMEEGRDEMTSKNTSSCDKSISVNQSRDNKAKHDDRPEYAGIDNFAKQKSKSTNPFEDENDDSSLLNPELKKLPSMPKNPFDEDVPTNPFE